MSDRPVLGYKVLTAEQMIDLEEHGSFAGAPVDLADGYIHLSTMGQLAETVDKYFVGQSDLQIATIDLAALGNAVKWELSRGGQLFPHIYGPLPLSAVLAYGPLTRNEVGAIRLPVAG